LASKGFFEKSLCIEPRTFGFYAFAAPPLRLEGEFRLKAFYGLKATLVAFSLSDAF
jgi:hypothetical protein